MAAAVTADLAETAAGGSSCFCSSAAMGSEETAETTIPDAAVDAITTVDAAKQNRKGVMVHGALPARRRLRKIPALETA